MKANETKLQPLIEGSKQYLVPLFQRPYRWVKAHWKNLWADLQDLSEEPERSHFMGAIVTMPAHTVPEGVNKYLLIDGQQRLTTIFVLLAAIRDAARNMPGNLAVKIEDLFLTNKYQDDEDQYKLLPTQLDRAVFVEIISSAVVPSGTPLGDAYHYFREKLRDSTKEGLESLLAVIIGRLVFVSIVLALDDNPYLIFESLNAKGCPLTQADLIRNYCFMSIHTKKQPSIYEKYWLPMETRLGSSMTEFIRHFLTRQGTAVKLGEIYGFVKSSTAGYKEKEILEYLDRMKLFSGYYLCLVDPVNEPSPQLRMRLQGLNRLDITTAYPFLLNLYHGHRQGILSEETFTAILDVLESFLVRRFVCSVPTHGLNKIFPGLYAAASAYPTLPEGVAAVLGARNFPDDQDFTSAFLSTRLYGSGERAAKTKYVLERLESSFGHHEQVLYDSLSIEHVMPQTLTQWWKDHLGIDWEAAYSKLNDTIGNLTLTGYNSDMSNGPFDKKREHFRNSHIEITKVIATTTAWTAEEIRRRGAELASRGVALWKFTGRPAAGEKGRVKVSGGDPAMSPEETVRQLGGGTLINSQFYALTSGARILVANSKLYTRDNYYWYGISPSRMRGTDRLGITHVAFGMGTKAIALVPVEELKNFLKETKTTNNPDGSIHHYHIRISEKPEPRLYFSEKTTNIVLGPYLSSCAPATDVSKTAAP